MTKRSVPLVVTVLLAAVPAPAAAAAANGGTFASPLPSATTTQGGTAYGSVPLPARPPAPVTPTGNALLAGAIARAPKGAPRAVKLAIAAANQLQTFPYRFGGGHAAFKDTAYDCSGTVSYMLHGAGLLASPFDSTQFMSWGLPGPGRWISVYANKGHAYAVVAGLRLDTSGGAGPRWHSLARSGAGFTVRHPVGL